MNPTDELNGIESRATSAQQSNGRMDSYLKGLFEIAIFYVRWQITRAAAVEKAKSRQTVGK